MSACLLLAGNHADPGLLCFAPVAAVIGKAGGWQYLVLPAITLGTGATASIARLTRSAMLDVLQQDYVRTARAKGLRPFIVVYWHALRNALIPVVTMIGLQFGGLMSGAVLTETIFAWPGIGRMLVEAINNKDFPLVQGTIMTFALTYALVNLGVDLMYAVLDHACDRPMNRKEAVR